jgi:hypothetical protein
MPITELDKVAALIAFDQHNYKRALPWDFVLPLLRVIKRRAINRIA